MNPPQIPVPLPICISIRNTAFWTAPCRIDQLMERVKECGQTAIACTDHGVMYGCVQFYKAAKKAGIKPIIGCEVYVAPRTRFDKQHEFDSEARHLVLLCENEEGYRNLSYLVSMAHVEGFLHQAAHRPGSSARALQGPHRALGVSRR